MLKSLSAAAKAAVSSRYNWTSGVNQVYGRDALDRMSRRDLTDNGTNFSYEVYTYDQMSRLTNIDWSSTDDDAYGYYQDGELKSATYGSTALNDVTYTLDKMGNRTSINDGGVTRATRRTPSINTPAPKAQP